MTVPKERTEAVLRTRRFLLELADLKATPRIPLRIRQRAISLLKHLPTGGDLALAAKALLECSDDDTNPFKVRKP